MLNANTLYLMLLCNSFIWNIFLRVYLSKHQLTTLVFRYAQGQEIRKKAFSGVNTVIRYLDKFCNFEGFLDRCELQMHPPALVAMLILQFLFEIKVHRKGKWKLSCFKGRGRKMAELVTLWQAHRINLIPLVRRQNQGEECELQAASNSHWTGTTACQKVHIHSEL